MRYIVYKGGVNAESRLASNPQTPMRTFLSSAMTIDQPFCLPPPPENVLTSNIAFAHTRVKAN